MKNKIEDLRNHLFSTIEGLLDEEKPMDIDRAQAVSAVAQTIINSAKVENDFLKLAGQKATASGFIPSEPRPELPPPPARPALEHASAVPAGVPSPRTDDDATPFFSGPRAVM